MEQNNPAEAVENEKDESDILANQDETGGGDVNSEDALMGAGPTDKLSVDEPEDFSQGDVDVVEQMNRASRAIDYPNRALNQNSHLKDLA